MLPRPASLSDPAPPSSPHGASLTPEGPSHPGYSCSWQSKGLGVLGRLLQCLRVWAAQVWGSGGSGSRAGLNTAAEEASCCHPAHAGVLRPLPFSSAWQRLPACPNSSAAQHGLMQPCIPTGLASACGLSSTGGICGPVHGFYLCLACSGMCGKGPHSKNLLQALQGTRGKHNANDALVQLLPLGHGLCVS